MNTLGIHSNKGGVGKTTIAINLAFFLAKTGKNVCLLETDFAGPTLFTYFRNKGSNFFNDYLEDKIELETSIFNASKNYDLKGELFISMANPSSSAINKFLVYDDELSSLVLQKLLMLREKLKSPPYDVEYFIVDTAPGLGFHLVNAMILSSHMLFVTKVSNNDLYGTSQMIGSMLQYTDTQGYLVANHIPPSRVNTSEGRSDLEFIFKAMISNNNTHELKYLGYLIQDTKLQELEYDVTLQHIAGKEANRIIHVVDFADHPFSRGIEAMIHKLFEV